MQPYPKSTICQLAKGGGHESFWNGCIHKDLTLECAFGCDCCLLRLPLRQLLGEEGKGCRGAKRLNTIGSSVCSLLILHWKKQSGFPTSNSHLNLQHLPLGIATIAATTTQTRKICPSKGRLDGKTACVTSTLLSGEEEEERQEG